MPTLSIIVVTYNSARDIARCLSSCSEPAKKTAGRTIKSKVSENQLVVSPPKRRQLELPQTKIEFLVIDNASADSTVSIVKNQFPEVRCICNPSNFGYARAVNQGLQIACGEFILLLNPDAWAIDNAIEKLLFYLQQNPRVAAVAPRLLFPDGTVQISCRRFPTFSHLLIEATGIWRFSTALHLKRWKMSTLDIQKTTDVDQPMLSALMLRRDVIDRVGFLDEQFPIFFNDVDWCYRIKQAGFRIVYYPSAKFYHQLGGSTSQSPIRMILESHRSAYRYLRKLGSRRPVGDFVPRRGRNQPHLLSVQPPLLKGEGGGEILPGRPDRSRRDFHHRRHLKTLGLKSLWLFFWLFALVRILALPFRRIGRNPPWAG